MVENPTDEELQLIEEALLHWWEFAEEEEAQKGRAVWDRIVSFIAEREVNDG